MEILVKESLQPPGLAWDTYHLVVPVRRIEVVYVRECQPRTSGRPRRKEGDGFDVFSARAGEVQDATYLPPLLPKLLAPGGGKLFPKAVHVIRGEGHVVLLVGEAQ
eukprot:2609348-Pyramimonas_sp.AAC.1